MLSGDVSVPAWSVLVGFVLAAVAVYAIGVQVLWWVRGGWAWLRRDRVTPLLDDDEFADEDEDWDLAEERSAEALGFSRPFDVRDGLYYEARERRAPKWELDSRAHYVAMDMDYPSGLLARVREGVR